MKNLLAPLLRRRGAFLLFVGIAPGLLPGRRGLPSVRKAVNVYCNIFQKKMQTNLSLIFIVCFCSLCIDFRGQGTGSRRQGRGEGRLRKEPVGRGGRGKSLPSSHVLRFCRHVRLLSRRGDINHRFLFISDVFVRCKCSLRGRCNLFAANGARRAPLSPARSVRRVTQKQSGCTGQPLCLKRGCYFASLTRSGAEAAE